MHCCAAAQDRQREEGWENPTVIGAHLKCKYIGRRLLSLQRFSTSLRRNRPESYYSRRRSNQSNFFFSFQAQTPELTEPRNAAHISLSPRHEINSSLETGSSLHNPISKFVSDDVCIFIPLSSSSSSSIITTLSNILLLPGTKCQLGKKPAVIPHIILVLCVSAASAAATKPQSFVIDVVLLKYWSEARARL